MAEPFLAEIRMFGFTFPPRGWALCDGQILPINQNQSLYSLLGTNYGGDGRTSFGLPDLRGRTPVHPGSNGQSTVSLGQKSGEENHQLSVAEMPQHKHHVSTTGNQGITSDIAGDVSSPSNVLASQARGGTPIYSSVQGTVAMHGDTVGNTGEDQAHNNMQPALTISFAIAIQGLFPSRS